MSRRQMITATRRQGGAANTCVRAAEKHIVISNFDSVGNPFYDGGGAAVVDMIAERLALRFQVTVVTAGRRRKTELHGKVRYSRLPILWAGPQGGQLLFHALLPFMARRIPHDLWMESFTPPFSTGFIPLFSRSPVVGLAQIIIGKEMYRRYRIPFHLIERIGLRFYRNIVVLNSADGEVIHRHNPSATVRLIPNGIELPSLDQSQVGSGEYILFLGRVDIWHKGIDLLLAAYAKCGADMPLLIAGSGTPGDERKLKDLIPAIENKVRWIGRVSGQRKQDALSRSAFMVMPSRHETFGLAGLEAMSYGKPVVHFDLPALRWMDGDASVPAFDVDALAREMRSLATDAARRREMGHKAYMAAQNYRCEKTADQYIKVVEELLGVSDQDSRAGESCQ